MVAVYFWAKALHLIAMIAWMAAMLYLPRLLVYHADKPVGGEPSESFKIMERRLLRAIMTPAMIATWGLGLWLAAITDAWSAGWFHGKLALVVVLSGLHGFLAGQVRRFGRDERPHPPGFYRLLNEVPTLLLIGIVILVVVKPF